MRIPILVLVPVVMLVCGVLGLSYPVPVPVPVDPEIVDIRRSRSDMLGLPVVDPAA